jgi:hypothetical protein
VEYDRGTVRARDYVVKLVAYYRYRHSGAFAGEYDGFPTLLVVTTDEEAEARFAYAAFLVERQRGSSPLRVLLTTTRRWTAMPMASWGPSGADQDPTRG